MERHLPPAVPNDRNAGAIWRGYVHPWPALAVVTLLLNDHLLKGSTLMPHWLTGKLSDVAGLFFFPLLLAAIVHAARRSLAGRSDRPPLTRFDLAALCLATALVFAGVQLFEPAAAAFSGTLDAITTIVSRSSRAVVMDVTDLLALPAVAVAYAHGTRFV